MFKKIISKIKETSVKYRKGFFEISLAANSPQQLVNSANGLAFFKHNKQENYVIGKTLFFKLEINYHKISEGFWVLYTESKFVKNVKISFNYVNQNNPNEEYYMLLLNMNTDAVDFKLFGQKEKYISTKLYWGFFKPKYTVDTFNYKNSEGKYITICFNKEWLDKNFAHLVGSKKNKFGEFINSNKELILCSELNTQLQSYFKEVKSEFLNFRKTNEMDLIQTQVLMFNLIKSFIERLEMEPEVNKHLGLVNEQRSLFLKIESHLQSNLNRKFDGIEYLTKKFSISETKLKVGFKEVYGSSVYQYFSKHQMLLAKQILREDNVSIKEIAYKFGYDSSGKFTKAFKKQTGMLPSEVAKEKSAVR